VQAGLFLASTKIKIVQETQALFKTESDASRFLQTTLAIQQLDEDHYLFRRGSTEVHIE